MPGAEDDNLNPKPWRSDAPTPWPGGGEVWDRRLSAQRLVEGLCFQAWGRAQGKGEGSRFLLHACCSRHTARCLHISPRSAPPGALGSKCHFLSWRRTTDGPDSLPRLPQTDGGPPRT